MPFNRLSPARLVAVVAFGTMSTLALAGFVPHEAQSGAARPELAVLTDRLDRDEPLIMAALNVPGAAVAVVRDGENVWSTGYGLASVEKGTAVNADTVFQVGSVSKTLTAWGVMHLVEAGQVSLDAPIESYLTRWAFPPSAYDSRGVTVSRVLSHTAGLNRVDGYPLPGDQPLPSLEKHLDGNNGGGQSLRIEMEPGRQFTYANAGYTLLQLMIEEVTGQRFSDYMQEVILDPLGMTNSTFDPDRVPAQATGYYPDGVALPHYRLTEQAAGGLYSTANDLALLLAASMSSSDGRVAGRGVLTTESVQMMMAGRDVPDGSVVSFGHLPDDLDEGIVATGNNGHTEGWIANMVMIPELGEGIVILTNSDTESTGLTLRAWTQWLGVSETFTTQAADGGLDESRTILLGGAVVVFAGVLTVIIVTAVQARRGNRRWLWQTRSTTSRQFVIRGVIAALAIGALIAFLVWPERQVYVALVPAEAATFLVAVVLAVAAVVLRASTRRASK